MSTYKGSRITAELEALRDANGMINLDPAEKWARRNKNSALHAELTWDDKIAGRKWRLYQLRQLIAVHITDPEGHRRYVSLSIDRSDGGGYRPVDQVMARPDLRRIMLNDAFEDLNRMQAKYRHLQELSGVWQAKDQAAATIREPEDVE